MMLFSNLDARSRRVIGYATLTYIFTVLLLLVFAHSAMSVTGGSVSPPGSESLVAASPQGNIFP